MRMEMETESESSKPSCLLPFSSNSLCAMIAYRIEEREATLIN